MHTSRLMNAFRAGLFLIIMAALSGCMVETATLLSERPEAGTDKRLLGAWRVSEEQEENAFLFVRASDDGGMDVLTLEFRERGDDEPVRVQWDGAVVWPTKVGDIDLLNVVADKSNYIVAYKVADDGSFRFGFMRTEPFKAAVEAGKLKGRTSKGWSGSGAKLEDTPERIIAFIRDNGGYDLFEFGGEKKGIKLVRYTPQ